MRSRDVNSPPFAVREGEEEGVKECGRTAPRDFKPRFPLSALNNSPFPTAQQGSLQDGCQCARHFEYCACHGHLDKWLSSKNDPPNSLLIESKRSTYIIDFF